MEVTAAGWRAHAALAASGGSVVIIAALSDSFYATAGPEVLWVGPPGSPLHGRTVIVRDVAAAERLRLDGVCPWRPPTTRSSADPRALARLLRSGLEPLGTPRGLGRLFGPSAHDDDITRRARPWARDVAAACARGDAAALVDAARPLLGLGEGLTPSGDDFIGGALFARRLVAGGDPDALEAAVAAIVGDATTLTHPISARLLADLGKGEGWAPLHDLAAALAAQDHGAVVMAARELTALGHSSGWSLHAGILAGLGEPPNP